MMKLKFEQIYLMMTSKKKKKKKKHKETHNKQTKLKNLNKNTERFFLQLKAKTSYSMISTTCQQEIFIEEPISMTSYRPNVLSHKAMF